MRELGAAVGLASPSSASYPAAPDAGEGDRCRDTRAHLFPVERSSPADEGRDVAVVDDWPKTGGSGVQGAPCPYGALRMVAGQRADGVVRVHGAGVDGADDPGVGRHRLLRCRVPGPDGVGGVRWKAGRAGAGITAGVTRRDLRPA